ncbi:MAG: acetyltransferase (GNAT) family [halophilic archaeon J07HX64]|jgi:Acetyltransferase (GNAT) family.|nr:MAG: acetyltransferase (GNAT) family [halophilic archaeon J07HX64]
MCQSDDLRFRQAESEDAPDVLAIKQAAIEATADSYNQEQIQAWRPTDEALPTFKQATVNNRFVVLLAETDSGPAGYGVLNIDEARIDAVFVDPEHSRERLGSSLVSQLETRGQMVGLSELTVVSSLNAQPFYESLGYESFESRTRTIDGTDLEFVAVPKTIEE